MATRSRIGTMVGENTVESVYCHWDGYLEGVGAILKECYGPKEVNFLIRHGDFSSLKDSPEHNDYYSQNGERGTGHIQHELDSWPDNGQEFEYLLTESGWKYRHASDSRWLTF